MKKQVYKIALKNEPNERKKNISIEKFKAKTIKTVLLIESYR